MTDSAFTFESGEPIDVGRAGEHDYVFESGKPVVDEGKSTLVFETGTGLGTTTIVLEDWESGIGAYGGNTDDAAVVSSPTFEGSGAVTADAPPDDTTAISTSSNAYIVKNEFTISAPATFEVYFYVDSSMSSYANNTSSVSIAYGAQNIAGYDTAEGYYAELFANNGDSDQMKLAELQGGSLDITNTDITNVPRDTWVRGELSWGDNGFHEWRVESQDGSTVYGTHSRSSSAYTSGFIGWHFLNDGPIYGDYYRKIP